MSMMALGWRRALRLPLRPLLRGFAPPSYLAQCLELRIWGLGLGVWGLGFRAQGLGLRA